MRSYSDPQLWSEVLSGSHDAWKYLVLRHKTLVYAVCAHMRLSQADAADCFQQTWTKLYQNRRQLSDPTRIASWLVTTARREAMRLNRQASRFVASEAGSEIDDGNPPPDKALETLELQAQLEEALKQIDQPCHKLLNLFFFADEDLTYEQIALEMGLAPNTLGAKKRRCLQKLREILSALGYEQERIEP